MIEQMMKRAMEQGQNAMSKHIETLVKQNDTIIENMNEIIMLQKKICDKIGIDANVEKQDN